MTLVFSPQTRLLGHSINNTFEITISLSGGFVLVLHFFQSFMHIFFMDLVHVIGFFNLSLLVSKDNSYRIAKISIFRNKTFKPRTYHEAF